MRKVTLFLVLCLSVGVFMGCKSDEKKQEEFEALINQLESSQEEQMLIVQEEAGKLLDERKFDEALAKFEEANDICFAEYNDEKILYLKSILQAVELAKIETYVYAIENLDRYNDEIANELKYEYTLLYIQKLIKDGIYGKALEIIESLPEYDNDVKNEYRVLYIKNMIEEKNYSKAIDYMKSLKNFVDIDGYIPLCEYNLAKQHFNKGLYNLAYSLFLGLENYKDSADYIPESKYHTAIMHYENGSFDKASEMFIELSGYKDSASYLDKLNTLLSYQGTWNRSYSGITYIIEGLKIYSVFDKSNGEIDVYEQKLIFDRKSLTNGFYLGETKYTITTNNTLLIEEYTVLGILRDTREYTKTSESTDVPQEKRLPAPKIGMTKKEVENSSWGKPTKINKTTTAYVVHEQWVYNNYKYIYFDDGIVTAIQE